MLTSSEIEQLLLPPRDRMATALADPDPDVAKATYATLEQGFQSRPRGDRLAGSSVSSFVHEHHGAADVANLPGLLEWLDVAEYHGLTASDFREFSRSWQPEINASIDEGKPSATLELYDQVVDGFRRVHHAYLDWFGVLLSHIYRVYGVDEVEAYFARSAEQAKALTDASIAAAPEDRVRQAAFFLTANFGTLEAIKEFDDRWEVVQASCGSCGRHAAMCSMDPIPFDMAVVTEKHRLTFNRGQTPVYRTHVAVLHYLLPMAQVGVPCPAVRCPDGLVAGPCTVAIYKDALDRRAIQHELAQPFL